MGKLSKAQGNMYNWVSHMWSPINGGCPHQCSYCYVRAFMRFGEQPVLDKGLPALGSGRIIFVGHLTDMFAEAVPALCGTHRQSGPGNRDHL